MVDKKLMNKPHFILAFAIFFFCSNFVQGQFLNRITNYTESLIYSGEKDQNHFFSFQYNYMLSPWGTTIGAQGGIPTIGINLARFFSKKIIIGVIADFKFNPGISTKLPSNTFQTDFENHWTALTTSSKDSANSYVYHQNFLGNGVKGNNMFNIGVMFSLFPQKYGGILLQVKTGNTGFQFRNNIYGNKFVNHGGNDKVAMSILDNWRYEITLKPFSFFHNTFIAVRNRSYNNPLADAFILSFYYERQNFNSAQFNGTPLSEVMSEVFMNKYGIDNRFGIKLGFAFY